MYLIRQTLIRQIKITNWSLWQEEWYKKTNKENKKKMVNYIYPLFSSLNGV